MYRLATIYSITDRRS